MQLTARGWTFDVRVDGPAKGAPVLLLHGFPQHSGMWAPVAGRLHAAGLRTIAPDQRGYSPGARPEAVEAYRIAECAADAVALLDALGIPRAHLVGHDWGAMVAWHVAGRHAERAATLTAVSVPHPAAYLDALRTDADQQRRSRYIALFRIPKVAELVLLRDDAAALRRAFAGSGLDDAAVERYVAPLRAPGALTAALNWYRAASDDDLTGLGPITCPTTYVWSDADVALGRTAAEACGRHVSGPYAFVTLPGISHWVPEQAPDALTEAILARLGIG
ncbi:MAG TPA: alpha/beta hydrolase [Cryptosporangiaceae bacterium]|nr:alpha/beta hydrolase [Cryptosporangiaceae bacterium]